MKKLPMWEKWYPQLSEDDLKLLSLKWCEPKNKPFEDEGNKGFVWIPGGPFLMGDIWGEGQADERPYRLLNLQGFWIAKHAVTKRDIKSYLEETRNEEVLEEIINLSSDHPVHSLTHEEALCYCEWYSTKNKIYNANLPTEAQWEKAASWHLVGDTYEIGRKYKFGSGDDISPEHTAFNRNEQNLPFEITRLKKGINELYGMSGNVWEWCRDFYDSQFYNSFPQTIMNVHEAQTVSLRGGSWANKKRRLRVSNRLGSSPQTRNDNFGFRLVLEKK